jgi:hypothetical protein
MSIRMDNLKVALDLVLLDFDSLSTHEKMLLVGEIGSIVAGALPFGSTTALLAGVADRSKDAGSDHVAEALEIAIRSVEDAEQGS